MPIYVTNEAQLDIPDGWEDQSVVAFAAPGGLPRIGLIITKQPLQAGETGAQALDRHLRTSAQKLRRFHLVDRKGRTVGGIRGWDASFTFSHEGLLLYQRQVVAPYGDVLWVMTVSATDERRAEADQLLDRTAQTLKFRRPGS